MAWWNVNEWLYSRDSKWDPDKVVCEVDGEPTECFTFGLEEKGFRYNEAQEWWQRTWTTPVPKGIETCLEVYKQDKESKEWTSIMYGNSGEIFYEQKVGKP